VSEIRDSGRVVSASHLDFSPPLPDEPLGSQAQRQVGQKRAKVALIRLLTRKYLSVI
jgi:hypothetical protein